MAQTVRAVETGVPPLLPATGWRGAGLRLVQPHHQQMRRKGQDAWQSLLSRDIPGTRGGRMKPPVKVDPECRLSRGTCGFSLAREGVQSRGLSLTLKQDPDVPG